MDHSAPQCRARVLSFCFLHLVLSIVIILVIFVVCSNLIDSLVSFIPLNFLWAPSINEDFFFIFIALAPSMGCDLSHDYFFKKNLLGLMGTVKRYIQPCERIIKYNISSFQMHLGSVSLAFFHVNMQNGFSLFIKLKLSFEVDTTKRLMSSPKCRSVEVINNPERPGLNHREVNYINYK